MLMIERQNGLMAEKPGHSKPNRFAVEAGRSKI